MKMKNFIFNNCKDFPIFRKRRLQNQNPRFKRYNVVKLLKIVKLGQHMLAKKNKKKKKEWNICSFFVVETYIYIYIYVVNCIIAIISNKSQ